MNIESFREYCLAKKAVTEETPFGPDVLVFKVAGKMFALTNINTFQSISLKCEPLAAISLRENYSAVKAGYHLNKKHWNTIMVDGSIADTLLKRWIDDSYDLVIQGLSRKLALELGF